MVTGFIVVYTIWRTLLKHRLTHWLTTSIPSRSSSQAHSARGVRCVVWSLWYMVMAITSLILAVRFILEGMHPDWMSDGHSHWCHYATAKRDAAAATATTSEAAERYVTCASGEPGCNRVWCLTTSDVHDAMIIANSLLCTVLLTTVLVRCTHAVCHRVRRVSE